MGVNLKRIVLVISLGISFLEPIGCGDEVTDPNTATSSTTAPTPAPAVAPLDPSSAASSKAIETAPVKPAPKPVPPMATIDPALTAALATALQSVEDHKALIRAVYDDHQGQPIFVDGNENKNAGEMLQLLHDLPSHAIDPTALGLDLNTLNATTLSDAKTATAQASFDIRLTQAAVDYVLEFRWLRRAHPFKFTKEPEVLIEKNRQAIVDDVLNALSGGPKGLQDLWPKDESYAVLRKELVRYEALAAKDKERPKMPFLNVNPGSEGANVIRLQKRLAFEEYYNGPIHGQFDETTLAAVKQYQRSHQLTDDGQVGKKTARSMNVTMSRRKHQIALGLQRWRESQSLRENASTFGRVNLPGFTLDIFEEGKRVRRHRVIVGSNALDVDREGWRQGHLNRTPFLNTRIYQVILNPTWMVPNRIRKQEIEPALEKNPDLFTQKGYREVTLSSGKTVIVQGSGKNNALGRVKFLLEKTNAIYLHDTDKRHLFRKDVRAFSHGCMRVHEALDFGQYLAQTYAGKEEKDYKRLLATKKPVPIPLKTPLDLFVEYNTVDVVDERVAFLIDIYKYDFAYYQKNMPPKASVRYGSPVYRPASAPLIPYQTYKTLKAEGKPAPRHWPPKPEETVTPPDQS